MLFWLKTMASFTDKKFLSDRKSKKNEAYYIGFVTNNVLN